MAHRDKDHPHLHMIANRVNPETGKAAKLGNDRLKLANWARALGARSRRHQVSGARDEPREARGGPVT